MTASHIDVAVLTLADTAYLLRRCLGDGRNWTSYLNDTNRGRAGDHHGLTLLPIAQTRPDEDRCQRPVYSKVAVMEFIAEALRRAPPATDPKMIRTLTVRIDPKAMCLPWRMRKATSASSTTT